MSVVIATRTIPPVGIPGEWVVTPYGWQFVPRKKPGLPWWAVAALAVVVLLFAVGVFAALARTASEGEQQQQTEQRYDQYSRCITNPSDRNCQ